MIKLGAYKSPSRITLKGIFRLKFGDMEYQSDGYDTSDCMGSVAVSNVGGVWPGSSVGECSGEKWICMAFSRTGWLPVQKVAGANQCLFHRQLCYNSVGNSVSV